MENLSAEEAVGGQSQATDWPPDTIVVRGGIRDLVHLARVRTQDGSWSVVAEPGLSFEELCVQVRHGTVRRTTASAVRAAGGQLTPTREPDRPPYHCDVDGLTAEEFDAILGPEQRNPVPARLRWRGTDE